MNGAVVPLLGFPAMAWRRNCAAARELPHFRSCSKLIWLGLFAGLLSCPTLTAAWLLAPPSGLLRAAPVACDIALVPLRASPGQLFRCGAQLILPPTASGCGGRPLVTLLMSGGRSTNSEEPPRDSKSSDTGGLGGTGTSSARSGDATPTKVGTSLRSDVGSKTLSARTSVGEPGQKARRRRKAESGVVTQPSVARRRRGQRSVGVSEARVPANFSEPLARIALDIDNGKQPPLLVFRLLLKKISRSAAIGYEWPTMQRGREIMKLLNSADMIPDTDCFRFYIKLAAKRAWKGEVAREELWGILQSARSCPKVTLDVKMYNDLLECAAGIAHATAGNLTSHGSSSKLGLKDGWKLIAECEKDGLMPDLITWAGVLDIAVGLAAQRIWQEEAKGAKGGIKGEDAQKILETMRTKGVFGDPERASPLYNRWVLEMQDIMREADPGNSWGG